MLESVSLARRIIRARLNPIMIRRLFYSQSVNGFVRFVCYPFRTLIPDRLQIPVTGTISVRVPGGQTIRLRSNPTCFLAKRLFWNGFAGFEPQQSGIFLRLIERADVFLDVGSNIGYYTIPAAVQPDIQIEAFEPLPAAHRYLVANVELNGIRMCGCHNVAVSSEEGPLSFFFSSNPRFGFVKDQLTATGSLDREQGNTSALVQEIRTQSLTLDAFSEREGLPGVDVIKIDAEGAEESVLGGARDILSRWSPHIFCEVLPGRESAGIDRLLSSLGYVYFRLEARGVRRVDSLDHGVQDSNDHLFVHRDRVDEVLDLIAR